MSNTLFEDAQHSVWDSQTQCFASQNTQIATSSINSSPPCPTSPTMPTSTCSSAGRESRLWILSRKNKKSIRDAVCHESGSLCKTGAYSASCSHRPHCQTHVSGVLPVPSKLLFHSRHTLICFHHFLRF